MSDGYRPPYTLGGGCGCAAALCFFLPLFGVWMLGLTLGDCMRPCHQHDGLLLLAGAAVAAVIAAIFGLSVRAVVNWLRKRATEEQEAGNPPIWAVILIVLLVAALFILLKPVLGIFG